MSQTASFYLLASEYGISCIVRFTGMAKVVERASEKLLTKIEQLSRKAKNRLFETPSNLSEHNFSK